MSAIQTNGSRIQVSWSAPLKPNGHLEGYTVFYRRHELNNANAQAIRVSASELSHVIESEFQSDVIYEIWVKARNRKQESMSSKLIQLKFDGTSNIDQIEGLTLQDMDETSMTLSWNKIKKADGYIIQLVLPHPYPKIAPLKTQSTSYTIPNIVNGAQYVARVSAYVKNYTGRSQSLILKRSGSPLPEVQGIETKKEGDHIRISWRRVPQEKNEKFTYGIYYATNLAELFDLPKHKTENNSFLLTQLYECQSYLIGVGILGPVGPGPLGKNPKAIETHYSERKPPRNLAVTFDDDKHTMEVTWEHSCSLNNKDYPNYIVRTSVKSVPLKHQLKKLFNLISDQNARSRPEPSKSHQSRLKVEQLIVSHLHWHSSWSQIRDQCGNRSSRCHSSEYYSVSCTATGTTTHEHLSREKWLVCGCLEGS